MASELPNTDEYVFDQLLESVSNNGNDRKRKLSQSSNDSKSSKKRSKLSEPTDAHHGMNKPPLRQLDLPEFNLTSASHSNQNATPRTRDEAEVTNPNEWQKVENGRAKKQTKKIPRKESNNYPKLEFSKSSRLQSQIKISDVQTLLLYILADGSAPQFISVSHRPNIRKVVALMVPGLEHSMFRTEKVEDTTESRDSQDNKGRYRNYTSPDEYYPITLSKDELVTPLKPLADMFPHVWPVKTPGDDRMGKMHSPLHAMLTAPLPKDKDDKKDNSRKGPRSAKTPPGFKNSRTRVTEFIHSPEELLENDYVVHPASYSTESDKQAWEAYRDSHGTSTKHGWVDTLVENWNDGETPEKEIELGSLTAGRELLAMDCEMCMTGDKEFSLTRISIVGWDGSVLLDELVKPERPIVNYLTQ
jgi:RNA exonuclease 1